MADIEDCDRRPAVFINIVDLDGNIVAFQIMEYEAQDFLSLRVDQDIAAKCKIERVS